MVCPLSTCVPPHASIYSLVGLDRLVVCTSPSPAQSLLTPQHCGGGRFRRDWRPPPLPRRHCMALARPTRGPNACGTVGKRAARNEWQETGSRGGRILAPHRGGGSRRGPNQPARSGTGGGEPPAATLGNAATPRMGGWERHSVARAHHPRPTPPPAAHHPVPVPTPHTLKSATHTRPPRGRQPRPNGWNGGGAAGDAVGVGGSPPRTTLGQGPASRRRAAWLVAGSAQTPDPTGGQ